MTISFVKMHGCGNDYVYVDAQQCAVDDAAALSRAMSDRHRGIGADGLILVSAGDGSADVVMRMFNADGSEGEMCGNGIRCVCKYAYENGLSRARPMRIGTAAGVKLVEYDVAGNDRVTSVTVDMGPPFVADGADVLLGAVVGDDAEGIEGIRGASGVRVSMGNPHVVFFVDDVKSVALERIGPVVERAAMFPQRVNVHFAQVNDESDLTVRTWERGSGMTQACGTGACAVCVAGAATGRTARAVTTHLPGGDLELRWDEATGHVFMTGPAVEVFRGEW